MKRIAAIAAVFAMLSACSPPAETPQSGAAQPASEREAILAAVTPVIAADLGQPVLFEPTTLNTKGDWAWIVGAPRTAAGAPIDWATTSHAARAQEGMLDGNDVYVLAQKTADGWSVRDFAVAPTDVAWIEWPQKYGAPRTLFGETAPSPP